MTDGMALITGIVAEAGIFAPVANEVRGFILAAPVIYGMYLAGGTAMAIWLGFCSLAGIALSVVVPVVLARRLRLLPARAAAPTA